MDQLSDNKMLSPDAGPADATAKVESTVKENKDNPTPVSNSSLECSLPLKLEADSTGNDSASTKALPDAQSSPDPFAYLDRSFTSEKYKVEIRGLPRFYGFGVSGDIS